MIKLLKQCSGELKGLVNGILEHSESSELLHSEAEEIIINDLFQETINFFETKTNIQFKIDSNSFIIKTNKIALLQIFINLISNGIKYGDKEQTLIKLQVVEGTGEFEFVVEDNGPGYTHRV